LQEKTVWMYRVFWTKIETKSQKKIHKGLKHFFFLFIYLFIIIIIILLLLLLFRQRKNQRKNLFIYFF